MGWIDEYGHDGVFVLAEGMADEVQVAGMEGTHGRDEADAVWVRVLGSCSEAPRALLRFFQDRFSSNIFAPSTIMGNLPQKFWSGTSVGAAAR